MKKNSKTQWTVADFVEAKVRLIGHLPACLLRLSGLVQFIRDMPAASPRFVPVAVYYDRNAPGWAAPGSKPPGRTLLVEELGPDDGPEETFDAAVASCVRFQAEQGGRRRPLLLVLDMHEGRAHTVRTCLSAVTVECRHGNVDMARAPAGHVLVEDLPDTPGSASK